MNKGMVSKLVEADYYLIDRFDEFLCAKEFSTPINEVEAWSVEKMAWAKTTLRVIRNVEGGK